MSGWGSWAAGLAKAATTTVTQFGQNYLDAVTAIDDPDDEEAKKTRQMLFETDEPEQQRGASTTRKVATPTDGAASAQPSASPAPLAPPAAADGPAPKVPSAPPRRAPSGANDQGGWLPPELNFVGERSKNLLGLGRDLVDRGAGMALTLLPEVEEPSSTAVAPTAPPGAPTDARTQQASGADAKPLPTATAALTTGAPAPASSPPKQEASQPRSVNPLEDLRLTKGSLLLDNSASAEDDEARRDCELALDPIVIGEFAIDDFSGIVDSVAWVAETDIGRRITVTARELSTIIDDDTGAPIEGESLLKVLKLLPERALEASSTVADLMLDELADVLIPLVKRSSSSSDRHWVNRRDALGMDKGDAEHVRRARAVRDLLTFGQVEIGRSVNRLCELATAALAFAKRAGLEEGEIKRVKEQSLNTRGECYLQAAQRFPDLEEAAECAIVILAASRRNQHADEHPATNEEHTFTAPNNTFIGDPSTAPAADDDLIVAMDPIPPNNTFVGEPSSAVPTASSSLVDAVPAPPNNTFVGDPDSVPSGRAASAALADPDVPNNTFAGDPASAPRESTETPSFVDPMTPNNTFAGEPSSAPPVQASGSFADSPVPNNTLSDVTEPTSRRDEEEHQCVGASAKPAVAKGRGGAQGKRGGLKAAKLSS